MCLWISFRLIWVLQLMLCMQSAFACKAGLYDKLKEWRIKKSASSSSKCKNKPVIEEDSDDQEEEEEPDDEEDDDDAADVAVKEQANKKRRLSEKSADSAYEGGTMMTARLKYMSKLKGKVTTKEASVMWMASKERKAIISTMSPAEAKRRSFA